ncbi:putative outer membrane starch-binding protein [Pontibacter ummariensis]|uniref:Starch-binding associating with outer membrane n=1 Tax=Pontibacter ummariensis TaxID=1610492 RepID=A0A239DNW4_9BACT|nr:RagB/SusD family nutrient uptake outer membrane protein [Pontibacter ummariensis]PRY13858.1 putative outer membrane starch-binding protein [Pontibacter ummariensis]SNS33433.1 Starch-binding associating with outer membrane [Pontibacter ummariensis]
MKFIKNKAFIGTALMMALSLSSCEDILEEQPRSIYEPGFFQTEKGVYGGLTSMYAHLRYIYGQAYYYNTTETGTDEVTYAQSADQNFKVMDISGQGEITSTDSRADVLWGASFSNINTASGIIENAAKVGSIPDALVAEARFFRAFDYFYLVQTFGGVPLDLGAGELKFNTKPSRASVRNTVPEVYTKAIFPDLLKAVEDLPVSPRVTGGATQTLARLYLAKAYLTYAWWLENPDNIPTYPETSRTDPDGHNAQWYYQQAYDVATTAIDNPGPFRLQDTYFDVNLATNDRNPEILLYADHTETSEFYNGGSLTYSGGGAPDNFAGWMMTWNYTNIRSINPKDNKPMSSVQREASQDLGRPWTRMAPTIGVIKNTFADKTHDSRYDGTFTTAYRANWPKGYSNKAEAPEFVINANNMQVKPGEAILTFLNEDPATPVAYPSGAGKSNIGAGELPGRADYVVAPSGISRIVYPGLWKLGPYRTDNGDGLGQPNAGSTRPFNIAKFSEFYFIAAEAAVKGAAVQGGKSARELINVIRARAGKWRYDNNGNTVKVEDHSEEMMAATPQTIDINYILAERSREYYGEGYRWFDLVRTQKWDDLASTYEIGGSNYGDHTPVTVTRSIQPYHYLRPIPQGQLDAMEMSPAEKAAYQNPGYN